MRLFINIVLMGIFGFIAGTIPVIGFGLAVCLVLVNVLAFDARIAKHEHN